MARRITREEGILAGESCGTAVVAVLDEARRLIAEAPDEAAVALMVVLLPDGGRSYLSKLYNDEWMRVNGLLASAGAAARVGDLLAARHPHGAPLPDLVLARTTQRVGDAIGQLQAFGISQMPVSDAPEGDDLVSVVGSISERGLLDRAFRDPSVVERTVGEVMDRALPTLDIGASLDEAFAVLGGEGATALVATRGPRPAGVITKSDLLEYLAHHAAGARTA
jgi:cystathionine beta-synthase